MYLGGLGELVDIGSMSESDCLHAGGFPTACTTDKRFCRCKKVVAAPAASSAPVTVTVSPQIQTQVSPQISPVFQQQFQPSGSPMTAGTSQTSAQPVGITGSSAPAQLPPAPAPAPAPAPYLLPSAPAPVPAQSYSIPESPAQDQFPAQTTTPTLNLPQTQPQTGFDWKMAAIIGASIFGAIALTGKRK